VKAGLTMIDENSGIDDLICRTDVRRGLTPL
jgi:hypothetical protein